jgi:hypothetical protein
MNASVRVPIAAVRVMTYRPRYDAEKVSAQSRGRVWTLQCAGLSAQLTDGLPARASEGT